MRTAFLIALTSALVVAGQALAQERIPWVKEFSQAQEIAKTERKLVLLHFYTYNCGPCAAMEANVFPKAEVASVLVEGYVPVKVSGPESRELVRRYRVRSYPTDVIVTAAGQEVFRSVGSMDAGKYVALLREQSFNAGGMLAKRNSPAAGATQKTLPPLLTGEDPAANEQPANTVVSNETPPPSIKAINAGHTLNNPHYSPLAEAQAEAAANNPAATQEPAASTTTAPPGTDPTANSNASQNPPSDNVYGTPESDGVSPETSTESKPADKVAKAPKLQLPPGSPPLAMEGRCPVTLQATQKWKLGDSKFGAIHRGRTYLFADQAKQQEFLRDPDAYAPAFCGYDPVHFAEKGELADGSIQFGATFRGKVFLFNGEATRTRFISDSRRYDEVIYEAMMSEDLNIKLR